MINLADKSTRAWLGSLGLFVLFLLSWQYLPVKLGVPSFVIPSLGLVASEFVRLLRDGTLVDHFVLTAMQVVVGFLLGALLGMLAGYLLGLSPIAEQALSPYILALQIAPKVAFAPLFVMWFGFTVYPKILVAILIVFFPIMVNVLGAMRLVDRDQVNLARSFSATASQVFWKIQFPACMPALFSGLRIGATLAVIGIVVGEFVGGNAGLGYLLVLGEGQGDTATVFVAILLLTVIGIAAYQAVILIERRVLHYLRRDELAEH